MCTSVSIVFMPARRPVSVCLGGSLVYLLSFHIRVFLPFFHCEPSRYLSVLAVFSYLFRG